MSGICVFWLFCAAIVAGDVPQYDGAVSRFADAPNVLLAHNYQDGRHFDEIQPGAMLRYRDETGWHDYRVVEVLEFQALPPSSDKPLLYDGENYYTPQWVHENIYSRPLVLQTCVYKDGDLNWGRLFVIAVRYDFQVIRAY